MERKTLTKEYKRYPNNSTSYLSVSAYYDSGNLYPFRRRGFYVSVTPVEIEGNSIKFDISTEISKSGFNFLLLSSDRANDKRLEKLYKEICNYIGEINRLFNMGQYKAIEQLMKDRIPYI